MSMRWPILAVLWCATSRLPAQSVPQNAEPAATIHSTVNEVALDLVVRDKKGRLIKNLKPGDVEIYEDGVRQEIRSLRLVSGEAPAAAPEAGQPAADAGRPPMALRATNLVCIVFHNLDSGTRRWAVAAAQDFIKTELRPGTWVGVFNLDSRLTPLHPFTTNREALLRAAANAFTGSSVDISRAADAVLNSTPNLQLYVGFLAPGGRGGGVQDQSTTGSVSMSAVTGADVDNGPGANSQRGDLVIQRQQFIGIEGARQMDQINLLIRQIGAFPGHKTVMLLSPGLTSTGEPDQFQNMLNKANVADLSVYAFDANGLSQISTAQASTMAMEHVSALSQQQGKLAPGEAQPGTSATGTAGAMMERIRQGEYQRNAVRTSDPQASLRALAEGTGGFLVANTNDLKKPFQAIAQDVESHYEADYHPSAVKFDGHFRKIEIKLARADWKVQSREGYFALPDLGGSSALSAVEVAGLTALDSKPWPHAFEFRSAAFQFRPGSAVVFELPASALAATALPAIKKHRVHASLFAVVKDSDGQIVDKFGQDFPYEIPDDQLTGVQAAPIDYTHSFQLPPGHYTVESVLLDREGTRASTSTAEFDSPAAKGIGLSSVMLVQRADPVTGDPNPNNPFQFGGREVVPMLDTALKASAKPLLYFVVYPDKSIQEPSRLRVEFFVDGEEVATKQTELPAPDDSGAIPMVVNAEAKPGRCEIKIAVLQGFQSARQSVTYTVAAQ